MPRRKRLPDIPELTVISCALDIWKRTGKWPTPESGSVPGQRGL